MNNFTEFSREKLFPILIINIFFSFGDLNFIKFFKTGLGVIPIYVAFALVKKYANRPSLKNIYYTKSKKVNVRNSLAKAISIIKTNLKKI